MAKTTQQQYPKDVLFLRNQEATQNQGESTTQTHNEKQSVVEEEGKLPAQTREKLSQRMWKSAVVRHPTAHSMQFLKANAQESYTDRDGKRTDSPSLYA